MIDNNFSSLKNVSYIANEIPPIPGIDSLGRGYDIFGLYANPKVQK
ncbi:hypothetical protein [Clostridium thailandense]